jgi:hypothetical protein
MEFLSAGWKVGGHSDLRACRAYAPCVTIPGPLVVKRNNQILFIKGIIVK